MEIFVGLFGLHTKKKTKKTGVLHKHIEVFIQEHSCLYPMKGTFKKHLPTCTECL